MDDVIFAHEPRLLDVTAQLKRSAHAALGLAINCAGQRTHETAFRVLKVTFQMATSGAESAVYDWQNEPKQVSASELNTRDGRHRAVDRIN